MRTIWDKLRAGFRDVLTIWWELARIILPVAILTELLLRSGVIAAIAPAFAPVMYLLGLPPELALALLAGILTGIWNAAVLLFVLVPAADLSVADVTVFSSVILIAHALPIEQQIIRRAGPGLTLTTTLRLAGAFLYGLMLNALLTATGWLSAPVAPAWQPMAEGSSWGGFLVGLGQTLLVMLLVLAALMLLMAALRRIGVMALLRRALAPLLRLAGIRGEAVDLTVIGLLLGISYGGGLLIREARRGHIQPRQVLLSCLFMGFAHSIIEDTLIVLALGADLWAVLVGRLIFAVAATALIAAILSRMSGPDRPSSQARQTGPELTPPDNSA